MEILASYTDTRRWENTFSISLCAVLDFNSQLFCNFLRGKSCLLCFCKDCPHSNRVKQLFLLRFQTFQFSLFLCYLFVNECDSFTCWFPSWHNEILL